MNIFKSYKIQSTSQLRGAHKTCLSSLKFRSVASFPGHMVYYTLNESSGEAITKDEQSKENKVLKFQIWRLCKRIFLSLPMSLYTWDVSAKLATLVLRHRRSGGIKGYTACPGSLGPFYTVTYCITQTVTYCIKWAKTSWTDRMLLSGTVAG